MKNQEKLSEILDDFKKKESLYHKCSDIIEKLLLEFLTSSSIDFHLISGRVKEKGKLKKKIIKKDYKYHQLEEITDVSGVRVITLFEDDVDKIAEIIEKEFDIDWENSIDKRIYEEPDRFGYKSLHYVVSLTVSRSKLLEYKTIKGLKCEIQVRSILQHAWAEIEHELGYKTKDAIPSDSRRKFSRIAGLLELADKEFVEVRDQLVEYENTIQKEIIDSPDSVEINKASVLKFVFNNATVKAIDKKIMKATKTTQSSSEKEANVELALASVFKIKTIGELEKLLKENSDDVVAYATKVLGTNGGSVGIGISILYLGYLLAFKSENDEKYKKFLELGSLGTKADIEQTIVRLKGAYEKKNTMANKT